MRFGQSLVAGAAALLAPAAATAQRPSFELACDLTERTAIRATFGRPKDDVRARVQRYRVDPQARTVTAAFTYNLQTESWEERDQFFPRVSVLTDDQLVFCETHLQDFACGQRNSRRGRTVTTVELISPTVVNLQTGQLSRETTIVRTGDDGSEIGLNSIVEGRCRRS